MIIEVEGVIIKEGDVCVELFDDTEGTIELEMSPETFDQLKQAVSRARKRSEE